MFATLLFLSGFHNVLLLEPMSVFGPAGYSHRLAGYFSAQLRVHAVLVGVLSGTLLTIGAVMTRFGAHRELVAATLGSALALPFLLLLWLARRMCYVVHRPSIAVWGSAAYFVFVLVGLFALHQSGWICSEVRQRIHAHGSKCCGRTGITVGGWLPVQRCSRWPAKLKPTWLRHFLV
jgi:uncharacterized membrane protein (UPF0136 family)